MLTYPRAGCAAIVARSFARIHETNLKVGTLSHTSDHVTQYLSLQKQGILPLWFVDKADYSRIGSGDVIETLGLADLLEGKADADIRLRVTRRNGEQFEIPVRHTMSADQLKWLRAGSALNHIRAQITAGAN